MIFEIKSYDDEATDFPDKEMPKVDSNYTCLAVVVCLAVAVVAVVVCLNLN